MDRITDPNLRKDLAERLDRYRRLRVERGLEAAREELLDGLPEKQAARLGRAVKAERLADGMAAMLPWLEAAGLHHEIVDASRPGEDAALEIAFTCTCLTAVEELGVDAEEAGPVLCDLELEATRRAFPQLDVAALAHRTRGSRVCVFRYSRPAAPPSETGSGSGSETERK